MEMFNYEWAIFSTFIASNHNNYIPNMDVVSKYPSPEWILIRKDSWENLSQEARDLINIILNAPNDLLFSNGKPSIMKVYSLLRDNENPWTWAKINKAREEVIQFIRRLE